MTESHNIIKKYCKNVNLSDKKSQASEKQAQKSKFR